MRSLRQWIWLFGMCFASTVRADPALRTEPSARPPLAFREAPVLEAPGGIRLAFATSDEVTRAGFCLGFVVRSPTREWTQQANAIADLELRRDHLSHLIRQRSENGFSAWRAINVIRGDTAILCLSAPIDSFSEGLDTLLEGLRPMTITYDSWRVLLSRWRNRDGLAKIDETDAIYQQAHALTWLGHPKASYSMRRETEQIASRKLNQLLPLAASNPVIAVVAIAGQYETADVESTIRGNRWVQQRKRSIRAPITSIVAAIKQPEHSYPRFARAPNKERTYSSWIFSWPIAPLNERHALGLQAVAWLIEQRLNRPLRSGTEGVATCELVLGRGFGALQVEIRSGRPLELTTVEKRVLGTVEQLRETPVSPSELQMMQSSSSSAPVVSGDFALDQALHLAQKTLFSWNSRVSEKMSSASLTPLELQQWVKRDLSRNNLTELVSEAVSPRPTADRTEVSGHKGRVTPDHRKKVRTYIVKSGESLRMIAHRFRVTIPALIRMNRLRKPNQIQPGTKLYVPDSSAPAPSK